MATYRPIIAPANGDLELLVLGQDTLAPEALGSGSRNGARFLRDDGAWADLPQLASVVASEALAAGNFVNIWSSTGSFRVRRANAAGALMAHGFVLAAVASGATATVWLAGLNTAVTGVTPGAMFLAATAGDFTATAPTGNGVLYQRLGVGISATSIMFTPGEPITQAA